MWFAFFSQKAANAGVKIHSVMTNDGFVAATQISTDPDVEAMKYIIPEYDDVILLGECDISGVSIDL